jgi:hypothetical protein
MISLFANDRSPEKEIHFSQCSGIAVFAIVFDYIYPKGDHMECEEMVRLSSIL